MHVGSLTKVTLWAEHLSSGVKETFHLVLSNSSGQSWDRVKPYAGNYFQLQISSLRQPAETREKAV